MLSSRPLQIPLNDDAAATSYAHTRTPAKALLKQRTGGLRENAIYNGSMTVRAKGKSILHTPLNHKVPQTAVKQTAFKLRTVATPARPLGDKTPFPNRQYAPAQQLRTPKPQAAKLLLEAQDDAPEMLAQTPECLLLPSAARRRASLRLPSVTSKSLKTPATKGNYWDVSDGDIVLGEEGDSLGEGELGASRVQNADAEVQGVEQNEEEDIEYMPPKVPEQPWEPPFDMPDYKTLGRTLLRGAHGDRVDDSADVYYAQDIELCIDVPQLLQDSGAFELPSLEPCDLDDDDPFIAAANALSAPKPAPTATHARAPSAAGVSRPGSRSGLGARPDSQSSMRSRSAQTPTPTLASTSRTRAAAQAATAATTTTRVAPATTAIHRTTRSTSSAATVKQTIPAPQTSSRRVQPPRTASSRPASREDVSKMETRSHPAKAVNIGRTETAQRTANVAASRAHVPGKLDSETRGASSRTAVPVPSSSILDSAMPHDQDDFMFAV